VTLNPSNIQQHVTFMAQFTNVAVWPEDYYSHALPSAW
jgi:hypothetical protein